jgi:hypothetical protein
LLRTAMPLKRDREGCPLSWYDRDGHLHGGAA